MTRRWFGAALLAALPLAFLRNKSSAAEGKPEEKCADEQCCQCDPAECQPGCCNCC